MCLGKPRLHTLYRDPARQRNTGTISSPIHSLLTTLRVTRMDDFMTFSGIMGFCADRWLVSLSDSRSTGSANRGNWRQTVSCKNLLACFPLVTLDHGAPERSSRILAISWSRIGATPAPRAIRSARNAGFSTCASGPNGTFEGRIQPRQNTVVQGETNVKLFGHMVCYNRIGNFYSPFIKEYLIL